MSNQLYLSDENVHSIEVYAGSVLTVELVENKNGTGQIKINGHIVATGSVTTRYFDAPAIDHDEPPKKLGWRERLSAINAAIDDWIVTYAIGTSSVIDIDHMYDCVEASVAQLGITDLTQNSLKRLVGGHGIASLGRGKYVYVGPPASD